MKILTTLVCILPQHKQKSSWYTVEEFYGLTPATLPSARTVLMLLGLRLGGPKTQWYTDEAEPYIKFMFADTSIWFGFIVYGFTPAKLRSQNP